MPQTADRLKIGEEYEPLIVRTTPEFNKQFMKALDSFHERYNSIVHPGILLNLCSITQSPSFNLEEGVAAVGAKFEAKYVNPAKLGTTLTFRWRVSDVYERRSRLYQICDVDVRDEDGLEILRRRVNNTFIGGEYLERRVKWEKETGYRSAVSISEFLGEGYEIVGHARKLTMDKLRYFSGGLPGPEWPARNIHTDREISIRSGIGRPVASGMMFESYLTDLMIDFLGLQWLYSGAMQVTAIVMAGDDDTVIPKAVIKSRQADESSFKILMDVWCENQYGNKIMVGTASGLWALSI